MRSLSGTILGGARLLATLHPVGRPMAEAPASTVLRVRGSAVPRPSAPHQGGAEVDDAAVGIARVRRDAEDTGGDQLARHPMHGSRVQPDVAPRLGERARTTVIPLHIRQQAKE